MNLQQNFHLAVIEYLYIYIYTVGVARSFCRRLLLDTVIVNCPQLWLVNHIHAIRVWNYQIR